MRRVLDTNYNQDSIKSIFLQATRGYFAKNQNLLEGDDLDGVADNRKVIKFSEGLAKVFAISLKLNRSSRNSFISDATQTILDALGKMNQDLGQEDVTEEKAKEMVQESLDRMLVYAQDRL